MADSTTPACVSCGSLNIHYRILFSSVGGKKPGWYCRPCGKATA